MATIQAIYTPDYSAAIAPAPGLINGVTYGTLTGTLASGLTVNLLLSKYRIFKIVFSTSGAPAVPTSNNLAVRFTLGISTGAAGNGATVITPTASSPMFLNNQENMFELNGGYDSMSIANLTTDNGTLVLNYCVLPLMRT